MSLINNLPYFYYNEKGEKYYDKFEALQKNKNIKFYFHDDQLSKINWFEEPQKSLKDLYLERAKQLRDEYDYLILAYSGGHDSANILETFYYNNIHLDEIFTFGAFSLDSFYGSDENHNGEVYNVVIPTLNSLNMPKTKVTLIDYSLEIEELMLKFNSDWLTSGTRCYGLMSLYLSNIRQKFEKLGKKVGIITGIDKPFVKIFKNGKASCFYSDSGVLCYGSTMKNYSEVNDVYFKIIFFYWELEKAEITRKQSFEVYRFFKNKILTNETFKKVFDKQNNNANIIAIAQYIMGKQWHMAMYKILYNLNNKITYLSTGIDWGGDYNSPRGIGKSFTTGNTFGKILSGHDAYLRRSKFSNIDFKKTFINEVQHIHKWPWPDEYTIGTLTKDYYFI